LADPFYAAIRGILVASHSRTSAILITTTLAVALTGYFRELLLAGLFGVGPEVDAFYFSLVLVQAFHDLLFGGVLTASVVPLLHRLDVASASSQAERARFVVTATVLVAFTAAVLAAVMRAIMPLMIVRLAPDLSPEAMRLALPFADLLVWSIPLNAIVTLFILVLNAHNRFRVAAATYLVNNLLFIAVAYVFYGFLGAVALPVAFLGGPLLNIPLLGWRLKKMGLLRAIAPDFSRAFFKPVWVQSRSLVLSAGVGSTIGFLMASQLIARSFAAAHGEGAIAALAYAFRLYEVPISLAVNPAATMLFPAAASFYIAGQSGKVREVANSAIMWGLIILFPAVVLTFVGAKPIVHLVLERGKFDAQAAQLTSEALRGFAPAILTESVFVVFFRVFYAIHRPAWTVSIAVMSLVVLVGLLFATQKASFLFVPLSVSLSFAFSAACIVFLLIRHFGREVVPDWRDIGRWAFGAAASLLIWKAARASLPADLRGELIALLIFSIGYVAAMSLLLIEHRKLLVVSLRRIVSAAEQV
jgi:putative peptidoglycan lipid II flippase